MAIMHISIVAVPPAHATGVDQPELSASETGAVVDPSVEA
jgi:hypothetical protein